MAHAFRVLEGREHLRLLHGGS